jgi:hypothetical protein
MFLVLAIVFFFYKIIEQEGGTCSAWGKGVIGTVGGGRWWGKG